MRFPECVGIIRHWRESREDTSKDATEVVLVTVRAVEQVFSRKMSCGHIGSECVLYNSAGLNKGELVSCLYLAEPCAARALGNGVGWVGRP